MNKLLCDLTSLGDQISVRRRRKFQMRARMGCLLGPYAAVRRRARGEASCPGLEPFCGNSRALSDFRTLAGSID
jgi:hypothetical protein